MTIALCYHHNNISYQKYLEHLSSWSLKTHIFFCNFPFMKRNWRQKVHSFKKFLYQRFFLALYDSIREWRRKGKYKDHALVKISVFIHPFEVNNSRKTNCTLYTYLYLFHNIMQLGWIKYDINLIWHEKADEEIDNVVLVS